MSAASDGTTIFSPGAARNCEYTTSECCAAADPMAPYTQRKVIGMRAWPPDM